MQKREVLQFLTIEKLFNLNCGKPRPSGAGGRHLSAENIKHEAKAQASSLRSPLLSFEKLAVLNLKINR